MVATRHDPADPARRRDASLAGAADWLGLAAAPSFAVMAVLTLAIGGHPHDALCAASPLGSAVTGMAPMYGLMGAVHLAPWFKLLGKRRGGGEA